MRHRLALLSCLLVLLVLLAPAAALAQDGNPFDGQLPPAQPTPAPTVEPADDPDDDAFGRETLWIIGGGVFLAMIAFGFWITRDARSSIPRDHRTGPSPRDGVPARPHRHERQAKAKARAKGRAQRQARKAARKGRARR